MIAYHLSSVPNIKKFLLNKSRSGFGTNFYGAGLYLTFDMDSIENWAAEMRDKGVTPYLYNVEIPDSANIIENEQKFWDAVGVIVGDEDPDSYEPTNRDLERASRYMVRHYHIDGLRYYNPEDGDAIVLWKPSIAKVISFKELGAVNESKSHRNIFESVLDESHIHLNGHDAGYYPHIKSKSDLARCEKILAYQDGEEPFKDYYADNGYKKIMYNKMNVISPFLPDSYSPENRSPFWVFLRLARRNIVNLKLVCYESLQRMVSEKDLKRMNFDRLYSEICKIDGNGLGHGECLFPFFFRGLIGVGGSNNGDFVYKEQPFDVKAYGSASFKVDEKQWEGKLTGDALKIAAFNQLKNFTRRMPMIILSKNCEYALYLDSSDFDGVNGKQAIYEMMDRLHIEAEDKGGLASHGLVIRFDYEG